MRQFQDISLAVFRKPSMTDRQDRYLKAIFLVALPLFWNFPLIQ